MLTVQQRSTTSRKALNNLQTSPNGKSVVCGSSSTQTTKIFQDENENAKGTGTKTISTMKLKQSTLMFKAPMKMKQQSNSIDVDCNTKKQQIHHHKGRRNSISLPDIHASCENVIKKSMTTPKSKSESLKQAPKIEEKENPNFQTRQPRQQKTDVLQQSIAIVEVPKASKVEKTFQTASIQCNKLDEDMLFADSVDSTPYWKQVALKRFEAWCVAEKENECLNTDIAVKDKDNEKARAQNEHLNELLNDYEDIRKMMLESTQNDGKDSDDDCENSEVEDSGYDVSNAK